MKKSLLLSAVLFVSISFFACKKDSKEETPAPTDSSPSLKVGDKWTYKETKYNTDGTIDMSSTYEESITGTAEISGSTWYTYQTPSAIGSAKFKSDGFWTIFLGSESIRYKFPATKDEVYTVTTIPGKTQHLKVISTSESVTVLSGTYTCYHYKDTTDATEPEHYYFDPKVGVILTEEYKTKNDGSGTLYLEEKKELVSYVKK